MPDFFPNFAGDILRPLQSPRGMATLLFTLTGVALVIWGSFVRTMVPLRALTVGSNLLLLVGALFAREPANVILYLLLCPINTWRLLEIRRITREVESATGKGDFSGLWLRPYMTAKKLKKGSTLFAKGDSAGAIFLLVRGDMELVEIGKKVPRGELFGEISMFSPDRKRTLTARCNTSCLVLSISEDVFKQLYFQEPKFAFQISNLITHRLGADIDRLRRELDDLRAQQKQQEQQDVPAQVA
jgi:CRP/FNR family cyclic AMP-dependent transcriptional regulator